MKEKMPGSVKRRNNTPSSNGTPPKTTTTTEDSKQGHGIGGSVRPGGKRSSVSPRKSPSKNSSNGWLVSGANVILGLTAMSIAGYLHSLFMYQMHENNMWFTNIKEVEREISFRTEAGLYYSYYKQVVNAPSFMQGVQELTVDKLTEHPDTINILARMNVYQEVFLAFVYRTFSIQTDPILFYIHSVFALQGFLVAGLFLMSWCISGSWLVGLLASVFYSFNRFDTTRVYNSIALREQFSLPFLWMQAAAFTVYFKPRISQAIQKFLVASIFISTFGFCLCWQFNQFIMMLQSFALFGVWVLGLVPTNKIRTVLFCQGISLLAVCVLQFVNKMILSSWALSFILGFLLIMSFTKDRKAPESIAGNVVRVIGLSILSLVFMLVFSIVIKIALGVDSDNHIYKFILNKFGSGDERDFDSRLYLCLGIFGFLSWDVVQRLTSNLVFPFYAVALVIMLGALIHAVVNKWRTSRKPIKDGKSSQREPQPPVCIISERPELAFHIVQSVFFGALACTTHRMMYLWTPYVCVLAAVGIGDLDFWRILLSLIKVHSKTTALVVSSTVVILTLAILVQLILPGIRKDMERLSEFWDPDTVQLMEWISNSTAPMASFTGSMQLLAGVKLCTGRPITNHPHYEDIYLRYKTKELYQIYGRREPADVNAILKKFDSHYIILEDSICLAPSQSGCRTPDIVDIDNGVMPDQPIAISGLIKSNIHRFCEAVRYQKPAYSKYFKSVFVNNTFRIYKVL